ncbi:MAG: penicillin-insensitive murein endopeptidase [Alphaproteobacteria bacterium]
MTGRRGGWAVTLAGLLLAAVWSAGAHAQGWWTEFREPSREPPRIIGTYSNGCIAGAVQLPPDGEGYQAIRVLRNRHWGHPTTIKLIQSIAAAAKERGLPALYIGDIAQPRGWPVFASHVSHQIGLDVDIWFNLHPKRQLAHNEREFVPLPALVPDDERSIDRREFTPHHAWLLETAARRPEVDRILVNALIKKELCETAQGDRAWLSKVRPWWDHRRHFHVRLKCPDDSPDCVAQTPLPADDGCGDELAWWLERSWASAKTTVPAATAASAMPRPARLPALCEAVRNAR